jgi:predicted nuclease with TOPRIM domain
MDIELLNKELDGLLKTNPDLISKQAEISYKLAMLNDKEARVSFVFEEMMDSFYDLKDKLDSLCKTLSK